MDLITFFIYSFVSIFVIVSPLDGVVTFVSMTSGMSNKQRQILGRKAVLLACAISVFFALTGDTMLRFFSINVDSLRVAGGILLFKVAFDMMMAHISRESITLDEINESLGRDDVWVFPIALPILAGPGLITTVIVLMDSTDLVLNKMAVLAAIVLTFFVCLVLFHFSHKVYEWLGYTGMLVFTRLMGLFLAALAVDFVTKGLFNIFRTLY
ncbi:MarC family protein [uncultured Methanomethylovorans sp.]|uniref:MarC family protein n=1 Tax=uncultured Methanomethylovorans sp. TaxID=183759 RepID=UPI002AA6AFE7|nr:MarC family protein [uncultured Methanomethylovorans sp.]